jgi:hypothetical protein
MKKIIILKYIQMKKIIILTLVVGLFFQACREKQNTDILIVPLNTGNNEALGAYFTKDNHGNAVLCWTEKDSRDSLYRLKYAVYNAAAASFGDAVTVAGSAGMSTTAESMGKIAFKGDGTVMALYGKRFEKEKNPFAGAIYYTLSADHGKTWSTSRYLHTDTTHQVGRSFYDITTLKDGELAAVWLDGRFGKALKGSALYFARTEKNRGFTADSCLYKGTCECCRTTLLQDNDGNLHIAYRSIMFPSALSGKQVRDMAYIYSADNGHSFSKPSTISNDNWQIEGCPHSGPSLAVTGKSVNSVWFTAGGTPGIYYTHAIPGAAFKQRMLISAAGRHPQMKALTNGKLAVVYEENNSAAEPAGMKVSHAAGGMNMKVNHAAGGMNMNHQPAGQAKIVLRILNNGNPEKTLNLSDGHAADHHAVLMPVQDGLLVAWVREMHGKSTLCFTKINHID